MIYISDRSGFIYVGLVSDIDYFIASTVRGDLFCTGAALVGLCCVCVRNTGVFQNVVRVCEFGPGFD